MQLDIRFPIGLMFGSIGVIITIYGLISSPAIYSHSLGINVNLWWGIVLVIFSLFFLTLAFRARKGAQKKDAIKRERRPKRNTSSWNRVVFASTYTQHRLARQAFAKTPMNASLAVSNNEATFL